MRRRSERSCGFPLEIRILSTVGCCGCMIDEVEAMYVYEYCRSNELEPKDCTTQKDGMYQNNLSTYRDFFLLFHQQKDLQELNDSFTCSSGVKQDSSTINGQSQRSKPHFRRHDHLYVICMVWWYGSMVGSVVCYFVCPRIARKVVSIQTNVNVSGNSYL